jgi:hypothetical protein
MSTFRAVVYKPASSPIHLDLEQGTLASEATWKALRCLGLPDNEGSTEEGTLEGWRLRARRVVEEGRWWSENDINEYLDRTFGSEYSNQANHQLSWVIMID